MEITNFKVGQELTAQKTALLFVQYYSKLIVPEGARIIWISENFRIKNCHPSSKEVSGISKAGKPWNNIKHTASIQVGGEEILLSWMGKDITSCLGTHFVCYSDIKS